MGNKIAERLVEESVTNHDLPDEIMVLLADAAIEINRLEAAGRGESWISVDEKSPPITEQCLGWNATANAVNRANTYRLFTAASENTSNITHWQPLPPPPPPKEPTND